MASEQALNRALQRLVRSQRTATLGTLDDEGEVALSRVPYAIESQGSCLIIHVSALAGHTAHLQRHPRASLLIGEPEVPDAPVHALPRVAIDVLAEPCADTAQQQSAKTCYLMRFPEAEPMTHLADFRFIRLLPLGARQVAGFGAARSLDAKALAQWLGSTT